MINFIIAITIIFCWLLAICFSFLWGYWVGSKVSIEHDRHEIDLLREELAGREQGERVSGI